mgnify:CR=1 FL=1
MPSIAWVIANKAGRHKKAYALLCCVMNAAIASQGRNFEAGAIGLYILVVYESDGL